MSADVPSPALAHIRGDGAQTQTVAEHLLGTAALCRQFAAAFDAADYGDAAAKLHDIGKYSAGFQRRLRGGAKVDHSTAGAQQAWQRRWLEIAFAVAGHHGGLPDGGARTDPAESATLLGRMKRPLEPYDGWQREITLPVLSPRAAAGAYSQAFFTRMLYSCLVDADYLDTEAFMSGTPAPRGDYDDIPTLLARLQDHIAPWLQPAAGLNARRSDILRACLAAGQTQPRGLYTLTVPTGGGKTVSSLAFALAQAAAQGLQRVIYVIPYTSIIDQNAEVFADILGRKNVLEHHAGAEYSAAENSDEAAYRKALAAENWDAPVVVTTSVQFFESLYGNRPARCRKLHNIANSVILFDEAQNLPVPYLRPCVAAIAELVKNYRCTAVLCTATQPALQPLFAEFAPGIPLRELCPDPAAQYAAFRRVSLHDLGTLPQTALAQRLNQSAQLLCIVNRRKTAQELFAALPAEGRFCLTTLQCPAHRKQLLQQIRARLQAGLPCRVVATSLIEAGVDVDFPTVYREICGLDSILQAAGRCNREGKRTAAESPVCIFTLQDAPVPPMLRLNVSTTQRVLQAFADPADPQAIEQYFTFYRNLKGDAQLDAKGILPGIDHGMDHKIMPFATVAEKFRLIESPAETVYVPLGRGAELLADLQQGRADRSVFRALGQYGVTVYPDHLRLLQQAGAVQQWQDTVWYLTDLRYYEPETGLSLQIETGEAWFV